MKNRHPTSFGCAFISIALLLSQGCDGVVDDLDVLINSGGGSTGDQSGNGQDPDLALATMQGTPLLVVMSGEAQSGVDLSFEIVHPPLHGTLGPIDNAGFLTGTVLYTPEPGFTGLDGFVFQSTNGTSAFREMRAGIAVYSPIAFSVDPVSGGAPLQVTATAHTVTGDPLPPGLYAWTFGTETIVVSESANAVRSHTFLEPGFYTVTLAITLAGVSSPFGCVTQGSGCQEVQVEARPVISGTVGDDQGTGISAVTLHFIGSGTSSGVNYSRFTEPDGTYSQVVAHGWGGTLSLEHVDYTFVPATRSYSDVIESLTSQDHTGTAVPNLPPVSGAGADQLKTDYDGDGVEVVALNGAASSDPDGIIASYVWLENGQQIATGVSPTVSFSVAGSPHQVFLRVIDNDGDSSDPDDLVVITVAPQPAGEFISGTATHYDGSPYAGVPMVFTGTGASTGVDFVALSGVDGTYVQTVPLGWSGTVTSDANYRLTPTSNSYSNVTAPIPDEDYAAFRNYYVDDDGDQQAGYDLAGMLGTINRPYVTIQTAANIVDPGDTVFVEDGIYDEQVSLIQHKDGTATMPITIRAADGANPIIDGGNTRSFGFQLFHADHWLITGFEVRNATSHGIYLLGDNNNVTIRHNRVHDCGGIGIYLRGSDDVLVEFCEVFNCLIGIRTNNQFIVNQTFRCQRPTIRYCLAYDNVLFPEGSDGIVINGADDAIIEYCLVWGNADDGIDNSSGGGGSNYSVRSIIRYCAMWGHGVNGGDGNGLKTSTNAGGDHKVHHNISFSNRRSGIDNDQESDWGPNRYYNNVCYGNGKNGLTLDMAGVTSPNSAGLIFNNVFANNDQDGAGNLDYRPSGQFAIDQSNYNFIGDGVLPSSPDWQEGGGSIDGTTGGADFTTPDASVVVDFTGPGGIQAKWQFIWDQIQSNFALQASSPCRNSGIHIPGITDGFLESAPDIGAVEFPP